MRATAPLSPEWVSTIICGTVILYSPWEQQQRQVARVFVWVCTVSTRDTVSIIDSLSRATPFDGGWVWKS